MSKVAALILGVAALSQASAARNLLVEQMNCGGLGQEWCDDETCKDDLLPVNLGGLSTICRKPEEARASGGIVGSAGTAETTSTDEEEDDTEAPAETEDQNCGGLGQEWCNESTCKGDLLPVNLGGLSTICRKPEEARASGGIVGEDGAALDATSTDEADDDAEAPVEDSIATESTATDAEDESAESPDETEDQNCGGLGQEWCDESTCKGDLVPVNLGGLSTICRKPEEAAAAGGGDGAVPPPPPTPPVEPPEEELMREDIARPVPDSPTDPAPEPTPETTPSGNCGQGGQPVCAGDDLDGRQFECDYGFVGESGVCVPYEEEITSTPVAPPPPAGSRPPEEGNPPTQTPPTEAPPPEATPPVESPPPGEFEFSGELTYYGGAGAGGACTSTYVPSGFTTVALNNPQYSAQNECGTCVYACFTNEETGEGERCFNAIVDNLCPECAYGDLDLGESGSGRWPVNWQKIDCPSNGALQFSLQGSNASYAKVKAEGGPASVTGMTCNGMQGSGTPDGYFEFNDTVNQNLDQGMDCTVTFSNGATASGVA